MGAKKRERKRKNVGINEDVVHADENGNGDAKTAQRRSVRRRQSESANAKLRNNRPKEPSREKKRRCVRDDKGG